MSETPLYIGMHAINRFRERNGSIPLKNVVSCMHQMIRIGKDSCPIDINGPQKKLAKEIIDHQVRAVLVGPWLFVIDTKRNMVVTCYVVDEKDFAPVEYIEES